MLGVALSVAAIALAFLVPGPAAPGSLMVQNSRGGTGTIGAACTHYVPQGEVTGAEVTIRAPSAGTVVVSATVGVGINHTFGLNDVAQIVLAASATECTLNNYTAFVSVPRSLPTDSVYFATVPLLRPFPVAGAASLTLYVNGMMASGAGAGDRFDSASLVAVFYPS